MPKETAVNLGSQALDFQPRNGPAAAWEERLDGSRRFLCQLILNLLLGLWGGCPVLEKQMGCEIEEGLERSTMA